jgi:hypothetical protein
MFVDIELGKNLTRSLDEELQEDQLLRIRRVFHREDY